MQATKPMAKVKTNTIRWLMILNKIAGRLAMAQVPDLAARPASEF